MCIRDRCKQMLVAVHTQDIIASHMNTHSSKVYVIPFLFCPSGSWRGLWLQAVPFQHVIRVDGEMKFNQWVILYCLTAVPCHGGGGGRGSTCLPSYRITQEGIHMPPLNLGGDSEEGIKWLSARMSIWIGQCVLMTGTEITLPHAMCKMFMRATPDTIICYQL